MRNDVPGGAEGLLVPPAGVARAGGTTGRVLIEQLRASVRALEQVPVSLGLPPAPGTAPSHPACSSLLVPAGSNSSPCKGEGGDGRRLSPGGGLLVASIRKFDPLPDLPPFRGKEFLDRLAQAGLHEVKPVSYRDTPAALGFALAMIAQGADRTAHREVLLWCLTEEAACEWGRPYGPSLLALGLDPARLLIVEARTMQDAAWALEEGLKSLALVAALGQTKSLAELAVRRLGLAAQASGTPCLLLSDHRQSRLPGTLTSWRIAARESALASFDSAAPGNPAWHVTLERGRGEVPGQSLIVEFSHESDGFHLSAVSSARAAEEIRQDAAG